MKKQTKYALRVLARETGLSLFVQMAEKKIAVPMMIGIDKVVAAIAMDKGGKVAARRVRHALFCLTSSASYQTALRSKGAVRYDRDGVPVEPVSAEHQEAARLALNERKAAARQLQAAA